MDVDVDSMFDGGFETIADEPATRKMKRKVRKGRMSYENKIQVLKRLKDGSQVAEVARDMGYCIDTVALIWHSQEEILKRYNEIQFEKTKTEKYTDRSLIQVERNALKLDQAMSNWFGSQCNHNMKISKPRLYRKFKSMRNRLGLGYLPGFPSWYLKWKEENCVETKSSWLKNHCMGYMDTFSGANSMRCVELFDPRDVFCVGEFVIETRLLPGQAVSDHLVVLIGCNLQGHEKCPLLVVGNEPNPNATNLPCGYVENNDSLMESDHFVQWLLAFDKKLKSKSRMVVLLLHESPIHPLDIVKDLTNIKIQFISREDDLPINKGISQALKLKYLDLILQRLKLSPESPFTLIDTLHLLSKAWWHMQSDVITDGFKRAGFRSSKDLSAAKTDTTLNDTQNLKQFLDSKVDWYGLSSGADICRDILEYGESSVFERGLSNPERTVRVDKAGLDEEIMTSLHYLKRFLKQEMVKSSCSNENTDDLFSVVEKNVMKHMGENTQEDDEVVVKQMNMSLAGNWPLICI